MDIQYKDKQIKKFKFLHILHDYPTSAGEILNRAANSKMKTLARGSTALPNSARNKSSEEFAFFNRGKADHRKSDFMVGSLKPSLSILANDSRFQSKNLKAVDDITALLSPGNPFQKEITESEARARRKSTDLCYLNSVKRNNLFHDVAPDSGKKAKGDRNNSADLLPPTQSEKPEQAQPQNVFEFAPEKASPKQAEQDDSEEERVENTEDAKSPSAQKASRTDEEKANNLIAPKPNSSEIDFTPEAKPKVKEELTAVKEKEPTPEPSQPERENSTYCFI